MGLKNSILFTLADGRALNLAEISDAVQVSTSELQAAIDELRVDGVKIVNTSGGEIYWDAPFLPLNEAEIRRGLSEKMNQLLGSVSLHFSLDSTNEFLQLNRLPCPSVCLAEKQNRGKGRLGKTWKSPLGQNIYLSLSWCFAAWPERAQLLSLMSALAVIQALHDLGFTGLAVKWPNDIYLHEKKLGGILLETRTTENQGLKVIIGGGLNVAMQGHTTDIDQPWTSLLEIDPNAGNRRNDCAAAIIQALGTMLRDYPRACRHLDRQWRQFDLTRGRQVRVITENHTLTGEGGGIDTEGRFQLRTNHGVVSFHSADVSLRLQ